ncbi:MAG: glutathione S-transferase family protein [Alphaproteobacteria bacterium]|jgi:glutathione S-transferase|nr:glutathione S-transferase family protein [Alphaproteobacteria bacterium]
MITLYHSPQTRSGSIVWLLEELEVPYQTQHVTFRKSDGTGEKDPANPHPHGKVPALKDDGETIFEGGAIALFLTDKYRKVKMGPAPGDPRRGEYLSWLFYRPGVMEPAFMERRLGIQHVNGMMGWAKTEEVEEVLNNHLAKNKYFLGDEFSAADIMVGGGIYFMMMFGMTAKTPLFEEYAARITARPAFKRMMERDAPK